ncbi:MAG TPA: glutamine--fructose-6-phosphate transaminase (isomerizing) [Chloroflexota bacterium]|nr:glutamine--fructose-6-phosphate transaminase (isomerizing) [Chloroflexota bacterium]
MCGIFGFVAGRPRDADEVVNGLRYLEYRGYDSWGVAVARDGDIVCEKAVGPITEADVHLPASCAALGHTRWATHGGVTNANAHPHTDCSGRLALIHNGIVENHQELRYRLRRNHTFRSQTDTEVLVHLLEETLDEVPDLLDALLMVFRQVAGLSAVAVLDAKTLQVAVSKNGSPLILGWGDEASYLASDAAALLDHTRRVTFLDDGQAAALGPDGIRVYDVASGRPVNPDVRELSWDAQRADLGGYAHYMAKEIDEQPRVLLDIAETKAELIAQLVEMMSYADQVCLIGCGTAYHAGMAGRYFLAEMAGKPAGATMASEMGLVLPTLTDRSVVVALSQSGETIDVLDAVKGARDRGARIAALVNAEGSSLDRFADLTILLGCGPERCVLATKSYTAKLGVMQMAAGLAAGNGGAATVREAGFQMGALLGRDDVREQVRRTARAIADQQHLFVLGRDRNYPLALEAALKIKEVSYMHAEGFAAGELKHGVIALVTYGTPCLILAPDDAYRREILASAAEVRARGALTIGFSPRPEDEFDITLPLSGSTASAPYEIAALSQLLAYELALLRGCDPDKPRNLAKSVTVR